MRGQDKDGGLTEVAEQTGPDRKSSLEESQLPPQPESQGDLGRGQRSPPGPAGSQSHGRREREAEGEGARGFVKHRY